MDGVFTRCDSVSQIDKHRCVRLRGHEDEHQSSDVDPCCIWSNEE
jgi:hypothetical protein